MSPSGPRSSASALPTASATARCGGSKREACRRPPGSPLDPPRHEAQPQRRIDVREVLPRVAAPALTTGRRRPAASPNPPWPGCAAPPARPPGGSAGTEATVAAMTSPSRPTNARPAAPLPPASSPAAVAPGARSPSHRRPSPADVARRLAAPSIARPPISPWPSATWPSSITERMAPVGAGPSTPRPMASITLGPNTIPSSSELLARRLAPCTPVHATSPAAHSPGRDDAPLRSVTIPPQW